MERILGIEQMVTTDPIKIVHGRLGALTWMLSKNSGWVKVAGRGLSYTNCPPLFSERNGFKMPIAKVFGYRIFWLKKQTMKKVVDIR